MNQKVCTNVNNIIEKMEKIQWKIERVTYKLEMLQENVTDDFFKKLEEKDYSDDELNESELEIIGDAVSGALEELETASESMKTAIEYLEGVIEP